MGSVAVTGRGVATPFSLTYGNATRRGGGYPQGLNNLVGREFIDVGLNCEPARLVQVIFSSGTGPGSRNASALDTTAVVRGTWRVGYRNLWSERVLTAQASAVDVAQALHALPFPELTHLTVKRVGGDSLPQYIQDALTNSTTAVTTAALHEGWAWQVTFFDELLLPRTAPLTVDGAGLYTQVERQATDARVGVYLVKPSLAARWLRTSNTPVGGYDAVAVYTARELWGMFSFTPWVLSSSSVAYWVDYKTLRVVPQGASSTLSVGGSVGGTNAKSLYRYKGTLSVNLTTPMPTRFGLVSGDGVILR